MSLIHLQTFMRAPVEMCFDLARNIDVHVAATGPLNHRAVSGITSGLIKLGEEVTWEGTFFGVCQHMTSKIVAFDAPHMFADEMQRGPFKRWRHTHLFEPHRGGTLMTDEVDFASPLGALGASFDALFLKSFLTRFLIAHNNDIRRLAKTQSNAATGNLHGDAGI